MGEMRKFRPGDILDGVPVQTINAHTDFVLQQRAKLSPSTDERKPKQKSPVVARLVWSGASEIPAGSVVLLDLSAFDPASVSGAEFDAITFYVTDFGKVDLTSPYAVTLGPIPAGDGTSQVGMGVLPNACWARVNVIDNYHPYAQPTADGHTFKSGWAGLRILWKATGTGEQWALVQLARGPLHIQLGFITDVDDVGEVDRYVTTGDFSLCALGNFPSVRLILLDVGNEFDLSTPVLSPVHDLAAVDTDDWKVMAYDVRKEGTPRVGDVVRVWTSTGEHVAPGEGQRNDSGSGTPGHQWIYCDVLNPGDYLRGLTTFNASNYQALVHEDGVADLRWVDLVDLGTEGGWSGGGGSGTVTSVTEGFAIDIAGTATDPVVHFDPTELGSYLTTDFQVYAHEPTSDGGPNPKWWTISGYVEANKQTILQSGGALSFEDAHKVRSTVNDTTAAFLHDAFKDKVAAGTYVSGKDYIIKFETDGASGTDQTERGFIDASAITNYNASAAQVLGHDATGAPYWYTIGPCA